MPLDISYSMGQVKEHTLRAREVNQDMSFPATRRAIIKYECQRLLALLVDFL